MVPATRTAVVVVNYNGAEDTIRCLQSLAASRAGVVIVVVDNGSGAHELAKLRAALAAYPGAELIRSDTNVGFGRGNNLGIRQALRATECEFVLLLNNDAMVEPDTLDRLQNVLDAHPEVGMATPRIVLADDPSVLWYGGGYVDWRKGSARTPGYMGPADGAHALEAREVGFASGCAMLVRRSVFETVGGFDPRLFMYEEDVELCLRVREAGWTIRYAPEALVLHRTQGSQREEGVSVVDMDSVTNPRLPFYVFHRTRNTLLNMSAHARGLRALLFLAFFPVVFLRTCLRLTLHRRWDGVRAAISGLLSFGLSVRRPFVDELGVEGGSHAAARIRKANGLKAALVEPVGGHGGMDYYDFSLCEGLSKAGASVTLYTCDETLLEGEEDAKPYRVRLPYRGIYGPDAAWRRGVRYVLGSLRAFLDARSDGARLAHLHLFHVGPLELFNAVLARLLGLRLVVTAHDVRPFAGGLSSPLIARIVYRLANRVIAHGRVGAEELGAVLGLPEDKVVVIPHGNYLRFVRRVPPAKEGRARLGLPTGGKVLLFFGQIKEVKGLEVLIEAMPKVLLGHPDAMLVIAGKVWKDDFGRYREKMERLGIVASCVTHLRYVPRSETADYYAAADLVVLPYKRIYQSGVLLMAMSYGKAVVVSDLPGMTEVVTDGVNGLVFPSGGVEALAAKIISALSDPEASRAVGERGLAYVKEHHDWDRIGRATSECYRAVLDG